MQVNAGRYGARRSEVKEEAEGRGTLTEPSAMAASVENVPPKGNEQGKEASEGKLIMVGCTSHQLPQRNTS